MRFVLDLKQARRSGEDYKSFLSVMSSKLVHVHINDYNESSDCLLPNKDGMTDFKAVFDDIKKVKECTSVIEVYRDNYGDYAEIFKSLDYLKNTLH